jgi:hypothetical protein
MTRKGPPKFKWNDLGRPIFFKNLTVGLHHLLSHSFFLKSRTSNNPKKGLYYKPSTSSLSSPEEGVGDDFEDSAKIDSTFPGRMRAFCETPRFCLQDKHRTSIRNNVRRQDLHGQALITFITEGR